jgi:hypothetical protein
MFAGRAVILMPEQSGPVRTSVSPAEKRYFDGLYFNALQSEMRWMASGGDVATLSICTCATNPPFVNNPFYLYQKTTGYCWRTPFKVLVVLQSSIDG